ncbi:MAG: hypothetical protein K2O96_00940 [Lachnospiraceae bacterium]|uniref:hypothetical protein n=1 Tax=Mediterraneibacter agrestimuris TaxID=2941333 RepID=UPI00203AFC78|nr:hypothetical protein [Mediterraneibacter agrestimuris]MDE6956656.1 hypothetical protein [Lachnospiraceae bacterium]
MRNSTLIEKVVEITVAKLSIADTPTSQISGEETAEFMQEIYNKLVELNKNED